MGVEFASGSEASCLVRRERVDGPVTRQGCYGTPDGTLGTPTLHLSSIAST